MRNRSITTDDTDDSTGPSREQLVGYLALGAAGVLGILALFAVFAGGWAIDSSSVIDSTRANRNRVAFYPPASTGEK